MSKILVLEENNQFFLDQLKIEGITAEHETVFEIALEADAEAIVFNNFCIDEKQCKRLGKFFEKKTTLIFLNPCNHAIEHFDLNVGSKKEENIARTGGNNLQIFKSKELYAAFPFKVIMQDEEKKSIGIGFEKFGSKVLLFGLNFNQTIYSLNQGANVKKDIDGDGVLRIDDGIAVKKELKIIPQADLLRQFIVSIIEDHLGFPLPRTWYYPNKKKCGIIFSHDSDNATKDDLNELSEIDEKNFVKATIFARTEEIPSIDFEKMKSKGHEIQLHAVYAYAPMVPELFRPVTSFISSLPFFLSFQKNLLKNQKIALEELTEIKGNRNHGLIWNKLSDQPLWLHQYGFEFDSTYGGNYDNGYLQGTGMPYFLREPATLQKTNVLEFSAQIMEAAFIRGEFKQKQKQLSKEYYPLNYKFGRNLLDDSFMKEFQTSFNEYVDFCNAFIDFAAEKYHSLITINFHYSHIFPEHLQEGFILEWYKQLILKAKSVDSLIENMSFFNDFWRKRLETSIEEIEWDEKKKLLSYETKNNLVNFLSQIIPINFRQLKLKEILIEGKKTEFEKVYLNRQEFALFNVPNKQALKVSAVYT